MKSLLSNHNEITIYQRNLQVLMTEIYQIINHNVLPIMSFLFEDIFKSALMKAGEQ